MARHLVFADRGAEDIELYPTVQVTDRRGNITLVPSTTPVVCKCSVSLGRGQVGDVAGNVDKRVVRVIVRNLPDGISSWSRVHFRDADWDMEEPPVESGFSRLTKHWELTLRSRNAVSADE